MYLDRELITRDGLAAPSVTRLALHELEPVYSFIYARVGNRSDAEDLTQQVAMKALPRLRDGSPEAAVRGYLYATARSVVSAFWAGRYRLPESELCDNLADERRGRRLEPSVEAAAWLEETLAALPPHYRQVLELRFLRESSLREVAAEMGKTVGAVKLMQLRALRAAAAASPAAASPAAANPTPAGRSRRARRRPAAAPGSAFEPRREDQVS